MAADTNIPPRKLNLMRRLAIAAGIAGTTWAILAYIVLPFGWHHVEHERGLANREMVTRTRQGIAGGPINMGIVGSEAELICALSAAGWSPANPVTLATSLRIIGSVIFDRPYLSAPVSALFYDGREEDLAFQMPAGRSADSRHHVRLWRVLASGESERPVWLGAATFDRGIGFNHYTLQVTHHIAADVDAERDFLSSTLTATGAVESRFDISGVGPTLNGRNGGGDRYFTDGEVLVMGLVSDCKLQAGLVPTVLPSAPLVELKDGILALVAALDVTTFTTEVRGRLTYSLITAMISTSIRKPGLDNRVTPIKVLGEGRPRSQGTGTVGSV